VSLVLAVQQQEQGQAQEPVQAQEPAAAAAVEA